MYTLLTSFVHDGRGWQEMSLAATLTQSAVEQYRRIYLRLQEPVTENVVDLRVDENQDVLTKWRLYTGTISAWLESIGNQRLATTDELFSLDDPKRLIAFDAYEAGFTIQRSDNTLSGDNPANFDGVDLLLTRADTDYSLFGNQCMFTVNGRIIPAIIKDTGIYLVSAKDAIEDDSEIDCQILDFSKLGGFTTQSISTSHFTTYATDVVPLKDGTYVKLDQELGDKTPGIVIDGYLHLLDDVVEPVGESVVKINWSRLPYVERIIRKGALPSSSIRNSLGLDSATLFSDAFLKSCLTSIFTYLVFLDVDELFLDDVVMVNAGMSNIFVAPDETTGLLTNDYGLIIGHRITGNRSNYQKVHTGGKLLEVDLKKTQELLATTNVYNGQGVLTSAVVAQRKMQKLRFRNFYSF